MNTQYLRQALADVARLGNDDDVVSVSDVDVGVTASPKRHSLKKIPE
jgi:hypothetical protein